MWCWAARLWTLPTEMVYFQVLDLKSRGSGLHLVSSFGTWKRGHFTLCPQATSQLLSTMKHVLQPHTASSFPLLYGIHWQLPVDHGVVLVAPYAPFPECFGGSFGFCSQWFSFLFSFFFLKIYWLIWERECSHEVGGGQREREHKTDSLLSVRPTWGLISSPWDCDLSRNQEWEA